MATDWSARLALAVAAGALIAVVSSAPVAAARECPAPGTGIAGALNMTHDATMLTIPMARDNANGNTGMKTAVHNTAC